MADVSAQRNPSESWDLLEVRDVDQLESEILKRVG